MLRKVLLDYQKKNVDEPISLDNLDLSLLDDDSWR